MRKVRSMLADYPEIQYKDLPQSFSQSKVSCEESLKEVSTQFIDKLNEFVNKTSELSKNLSCLIVI